MNDQMLAQIEREVLGWSGVGKQRDENGPAGLLVTAYGFGRREIRHVHHGDAFLADFQFPREVANVLWAAMHGVVDLELAGHLREGEGERVFARTLRAVGTGLLNEREGGKQ